MEIYKIFNPKNWPDDQNSIFWYGSEELPKIKELYASDAELEELRESWRNMVQDIMNAEQWCKFKSGSIIGFWYNSLKNNLVPAPLIPIIRKILSIPIGSADAELSFTTLSLYI